MEKYQTFFSGKGFSKKEITLVENGEIICDDDKVANTLNTFFENAVTTLGIPNIEFHLIDPGDTRQDRNNSKEIFKAFQYTENKRKGPKGYLTFNLLILLTLKLRYLILKEMCPVPVVVFHLLCYKII